MSEHQAARREEVVAGSAGEVLGWAVLRSDCSSVGAAAALPNFHPWQHPPGGAGKVPAATNGWEIQEGLSLWDSLLQDLTIALKWTNSGGGVKLLPATRHALAAKYF